MSTAAWKSFALREWNALMFQPQGLELYVATAPQGTLEMETNALVCHKMNSILQILVKLVYRPQSKFSTGQLALLQGSYIFTFLKRLVL